MVPNNVLYDIGVHDLLKLLRFLDELVSDGGPHLTGRLHFDVGSMKLGWDDDTEAHYLVRK